MRNVATTGVFAGMNPRLTLAATLLILGLGAAGALLSERVEDWIAVGRATITPVLQWYYVLVVAFLLALVIWLGVGRFKNVRLGRDDEVPEYRTLSWLAMLFAAGMGVGLLFWAVAEPLSHFQGNPFTPDGGTRAAADAAMVLTYFHWGLSAWGIFAVVALTLAYFGFRRGYPLTFRSTLHPLLGKHIHGASGDVVDLLAIVATVFGIATTLGLGVQQLNTGLATLVGLVVTDTTQVVLTAVVMAVAVVSVISGLDRGVRRISEINFWLSAALLAFFLTLGPTQYLLALVVQSTGQYLQHLLAMALDTHANEPGDWQGEWTIFYWGWWLAWSPFVGLFIARISRGRTLREFVMGVLMVPTLITFVWLGLFGGSALYQELFADGGIVEAINRDITLGVYATLEGLGVGVLGTAGAVLVTVLIATYLITSANAGLFVVNSLLTHGGTDQAPAHAFIWGLALALITIVLLVAGGLHALQSAVIMAGVPFSLVVLAMVVGLLRALEEERFAPVSGERAVLPAEPWVEGRDEE